MARELPVEKLISQYFKLADINDSFEALRKGNW